MMQGDCRTILHVWLKVQTLYRLHLFSIFFIYPQQKQKPVGINNLKIVVREKYVCMLVKEGGVETHPRAAEWAGGEAGRGSADGSRPVGTDSGGGVRRFPHTPAKACG